MNDHNYRGAQAVGGRHQSWVLQRKTCACGKSISEKGGECEDCQKKREAAQSSIIQRSATNGAGIDTLPPSVHETLQSPGQPLDDRTRETMESRFGHDFSGVRVHADGQAARSARDVAAHAYTVGQDVAFGAGEYRPNTSDGQRLIAHELTHVLQQVQHRVSTSDAGQGDDSHLEREAESAANALGGQFGVIPIRQETLMRLSRAPLPTTSPSESGLRSHGLTQSEIAQLNAARMRLIPASERTTAIVGILVAEDGRVFEFRSGGGQGFYSHIEGKVTALMTRLGIKNGTLLVELEPCQICDRSVYSQSEGLEKPLIGSQSGKPIDRQTPKINTGLNRGSRLTVVDPTQASTYSGVRSPAAPLPPSAQKTSEGAPPKAVPETPPPKAVPEGAPPRAAIETPPLKAVPEGAPPRAAPSPVLPPKTAPAEPGVNPKASGKWAGTGGGLFGVFAPLIMGWVHKKAVEKRTQEQANKQGYVSPEAPSGEGFLYDLGAWFLDPFRDSEKSVGLDKRLNLPVWRARLREKVNSLKPGESFNMTWDIGKCKFDFMGNQEVEQREVTYTKQPDGTVKITSGNPSGIPNLNGIISPTVSDEAVRAVISADPCSRMA